MEMEFRLPASLVGRTVAKLGQLKTTRSQISVFLRGIDGIGKSTLAHEIFNQLKANGTLDAGSVAADVIVDVNINYQNPVGVQMVDVQSRVYDSFDGNRSFLIIVSDFLNYNGMEEYFKYARDSGYAIVLIDLMEVAIGRGVFRNFNFYSPSAIVPEEVTLLVNLICANKRHKLPDAEVLRQIRNWSRNPYDSAVTLFVKHVKTNRFDNAEVDYIRNWSEQP